MLYREDTILNELMWEYEMPYQNSLNLIEVYKQKRKYGLLCRLIEIRDSIKQEA